MAQPAVKFCRSIAATSFALSKRFDSALDFGGSLRHSFQLANERQQVSQLVFDQFVIEECFLPIFNIQELPLELLDLLFGKYPCQSSTR